MNVVEKVVKVPKNLIDLVVDIKYYLFIEKNQEVPIFFLSRLIFIEK